MVENAKDLEKEKKVSRGTGKQVDLFDGDTDPHTGIDVGANKAVQEKEISKDVCPELKDAVEDVPAGAPWAEAPEGKIIPIEKSGDPTTPLPDADLERFANQGTPDYQGQKADMEAETQEVGKKVKGHKTKSGL